MIRILTLLSIALFCVSESLWSQDSILFPVTTIDSTLLKNANAIVRTDKMTVKVMATNKMVIRNQFALTVLNKAGEDYLNLSQFYSPEIKIKKLEAYIYDENGQLIKKIKKGDFADRAYAAGYTTVASDSRYKHISYISNTFPYTVDFHTEYESTNTGFLPTFYFIGNYNVGIESSEFRFENPTAIPFRYVEKNFDLYTINREETKTMSSWKITGIPPVLREEKAPSASDIFPYIKLSLQDFTLVNVPAHVTDWKTMGDWQNKNLLRGRATLPEPTLQEIEYKTAGINDTLEKAKVIYKYVQEKTRYVSIQLGIGGWQPMQAKDVDRLGYGDCKALTNYTKALLNSQGIPAYYSVIYGNQDIQDIDEDIVALQGNHVILNIPNGSDDIWLECTSQTTPFGYIAGFTDDRKALVLTPEGGIIKKTKAYKPEDNLLSTKADIHLFPSNTITAKLNRKSSGTYYTKQQAVAHTKDKERYYKDKFRYVNNLRINETNFEANTDAAVFTENIHVTVDKVASRAGDNFILRPFVFGRTSHRKISTKNRQFPIVIQRGYTTEDSYTLTIDPSFEIGEISEEIHKIDSMFGSYTFQLQKVDAHTLQLDRKLTVYPGEFASDQVGAYNQFYKKIRRSDNRQVILKSKT